MEYCIFNVGITKSAGICCWHRLSIAIYIRQFCTFGKCITRYGLYTIAYYYGGQAATILERTTPDAGHGVGYGDARQTATVMERRTPDAGHRVGCSIVYNGFWNDNVVCVFI